MKKISILLLMMLLLCACGRKTDAAPVQTAGSSDSAMSESRTVYICTSHSLTSGDSVTRTDYLLDEANQVVAVNVYTNDVQTNHYDVECDQHGNYIRWISEDMTITYDYDQQGNPLGKSIYSGEALISTTEYAWENGNQISLTNRNGPQEQRTAYFYNESGHKIREEVYLNSVLVSYTHYTVSEEGQPVTQAVYLADGTLHSTVGYVYDGPDCTATTTLSDGTVESRTVYTYDDHGNLIRTTVYDSEDNVLSQTTDTWTAIQVPPDSQRASI